MLVSLAFAGFFVFVSLACIPFGPNDLSLLDRFKGIRTPAEHDSKGLE